MTRARWLLGLSMGCLGVALSASSARAQSKSAAAAAAPRPLSIAVTQPKLPSRPNLPNPPRPIPTAGGGVTTDPQPPAPKPVATAAQVTITGPQVEQLKVENVGRNHAEALLKVSDGAAVVDVQPGQQLLVKRDEALTPPTVALSETAKASLLATVLVGTRDADSRPNVRQFQPFVLAEVTPLRWSSQARAYQTTLLVGLDPLPGDSGADLKLDTPIPFQVTGENLESIAPTMVAISVAGPGGYQRVVLSTSRFGVPVKVSAHSIAGDGAFTATIEPGPVSFAISAGEARIDGLGLGATTISARRLAANGVLLPGASAASVELTTSAGSLRPSRIDIAASAGDGRTQLVSSSWGEASVSQVGAPGGLAVRFAFPWLKLLLSIAGAAAAGALQVLTSPKRAWIPGVLGAVLGGLALTILVALGAPFAPEWLRRAMSSELAWLAIGVVGGYPGPKTLEWLNEKLFGGKGDPKPEPQPQH